ncbi:MAG: hypothetical protein Q3962_06720 [Corynebacterium sp.]|nr:hypothetical protein [Corynebacterium sp.]
MEHGKGDTGAGLDEAGCGGVDKLSESVLDVLIAVWAEVKAGLNAVVEAPAHAGGKWALMEEDYAINGGADHGPADGQGGERIIASMRDSWADC